MKKKFYTFAELSNLFNEYKRKDKEIKDHINNRDGDVFLWMAVKELYSAKGDWLRNIISNMPDDQLDRWMDYNYKGIGDGTEKIYITD